MTKKEALKIVDKTIADLKELADSANEVIQSLEKQPRLLSVYTGLYSDTMYKLSNLEELRLDIENHDDTEVKVSRLYDMPEVIDDGLNLKEENDDED